MSRFSSLLTSIYTKLDAPKAIKNRILLEIAADLDDAYEFYREQGKSEPEATRLAQEHFVLDDDAIQELSALHQPAMKKWLDAFSAQMQSSWERAIVFIFLFCLTLVTGKTMSQVTFWENASVFVWPVLAVGIAGIIQFLYKFFQLYKKQKDIKTLRSGIHHIAYLGVFSLALGFTGYFYQVMLYGVDTVFPASSLLAAIFSVSAPGEQLANIF